MKNKKHKQTKNQAKNQAKNKFNADSVKKLAVILAASLVLSLLISNFSALSLIFSGTKKQELDLNKYFGSDRVTITSESPAEFRDIDTDLKSVSLTFYKYSVMYSEVRVSFTDDNFRLDGGYEYNTASKLMSIGTGIENYMELSSFGKARSIKISCDDDVTLTGVTLNAPPKFSFSLIGWLIIFLIMNCIAFGTWKDILGESDRRYILITGCVMCLMVIFVTGVIHNTCDEDLMMNIPDDVTEEDQYTQLFDAFHKGQFNLDIDYDTEKLDALENPYDRSERNENDLHGVFWDRVYYNGNFYSYFGTAPVFTVYYPVYILTGKIPTPLFASMLLCVYCVIFLTLLYELFLRRFCNDVPRELAILGLCALLFGSVIFAVASEAQFYFIAVLSGIAWTAAFLYFLLSAYFCEDFRRRVILLVISGVSVALIAASRPTLLLYCFTAIIPAWDIMKNKKETTKNKFIYAAAIGVPVILGAALIMSYNYSRFGSVMEFGFNYQLTVSRAQANTIKLSMVAPALYHFFFQQPKFNSSFPYIELQSNALKSYTRYNYAGITMGVFSYPMTWGMALLPFTLSRRNKTKTLMISSLAVCAFLMAFIDMCKAGSHYRYTTDIAFVVLLVSVTAIFNIGSWLRERSQKAYKIFFAMTAAAMLATMIIGTLTMFANEGDTMIHDYVQATEYLRGLA